MAEAALPEHTDRDEAEAIEHLTQSQTEQILIPICNEHPCRLRFDCDLAKWQRQQYDKDMNRHCSGPSKYVQLFLYQDYYFFYLMKEHQKQVVFFCMDVQEKIQLTLIYHPIR